MFNLKVCLLFIVCVSVFCKTSNAQVGNLSHQLGKYESELSITMKRMACFDGCRVYNLEIQSNGKVIFEGIQYTKIKGKIRSKLSKQKINQLISEIDAAGFFDLKDSYVINSDCPMMVNHNPDVILTIKLNGKEKTVTHYLGCPEKFVKFGEPWKVFPQQLYNLENKIDEIVETKRWVGERK